MLIYTFYFYCECRKLTMTSAQTHSHEFIFASLKKRLEQSLKFHFLKKLNKNVSSTISICPSDQIN